MMEQCKFRRNLYINDTDLDFDRPKDARESDPWALEIDGLEVTRVDENGQWWVGGCKVNKDWCQRVPKLQLIEG